MIKFWNAPLLTSGGIANDFSFPKTDPKSKYFLLVRAGTLDLQHIADVMVSILNKYLIIIIDEVDFLHISHIVCEANCFQTDFFLSVRYSWKNVLLINENDGYSEVFGKQTCGLMTKTLMEMFKGNSTKANITYNVFDLSKNKHNSMTENLRIEVGSKHASKSILL